jgi:hypothetical protein
MSAGRAAAGWIPAFRLRRVTWNAGITTSHCKPPAGYSMFVKKPRDLRGAKLLWATLALIFAHDDTSCVRDLCGARHCVIKASLIKTGAAAALEPSGVPPWPGG